MSPSTAIFLLIAILRNLHLDSDVYCNGYGACLTCSQPWFNPSHQIRSPEHIQKWPLNTKAQFLSTVTCGSIILPITNKNVSKISPLMMLPHFLYMPWHFMYVPQLCVITIHLHGFLLVYRCEIPLKMILCINYMSSLLYYT